MFAKHQLVPATTQHKEPTGKNWICLIVQSEKMVKSYHYASTQMMSHRQKLCKYKHNMINAIRWAMFSVDLCTSNGKCWAEWKQNKCWDFKEMMGWYSPIFFPQPVEIFACSFPLFFHDFSPKNLPSCSFHLNINQRQLPSFMPSQRKAEFLQLWRERQSLSEAPNPKY